MMIHLFHLELVEQNKFQGNVDMWLIVSSGRTYCQQLSCDFRCQATPTGGMCFCNTGYQIDPRDNRTCIGTCIPPIKSCWYQITWQNSVADLWSTELTKTQIIDSLFNLKIHKSTFQLLHMQHFIFCPHDMQQFNE